MSPVLDTTPLRLVLPKGRMQDGVLGLLRDAGIALTLGARTSRPVISLSDVSGGAGCTCRSAWTSGGPGGARPVC